VEQRLVVVVQVKLVKTAFQIREQVTAEMDLQMHFVQVQI
jgi:hypothetical protein